MSSKYTPGPWVAETAINRGYSFKAVRGSDGSVVAVLGDNSEAPNEVEKANAALIAAAPEMLEALKLLAKHFQEPELRKVTGVSLEGFPSSVSIEMTIGTVKRIGAAIAKAGGQDK